MLGCFGMDLIYFRLELNSLWLELIENLVSKIQNPAEPCFKEHSGMYKITLLFFLLWKPRMFRSNPSYPEFQTKVESHVKLA